MLNTNEKKRNRDQIDINTTTATTNVTITISNNINNDLSQVPLKKKKKKESTATNSTSTIPIYRGKFKQKWLKKHSSLLKHSESLQGMMITCGIQAETRALGCCSHLLDLVTPTLFPQVKSIPPIPLATLLMDMNDHEEEEEVNNEEKGDDNEKKNDVKEKTNQERTVSKVKQFEAIDTGCSGMLFYQFNINIDPTLFFHTLLNHIASIDQQEQEKYKHLLRYTSRWIPLNFICHVTTERIMDCFQHRVLPYLCQLIAQQREEENKKEKPSVAIVTEIKNNIHFSKQDLIQCIAPQLPDNIFTIDLKQPDYVIFVTIFKSVCGIGILKNYYSLKKYNLLHYLSSSSPTS
ncbi:hypothetical protein BJ944DRAFT_268026 [Cunninghamella echinulata]|nr:hypothetical protein BJ944DRAFT_268026 [Cunninghamella echinulata]